LGANVFVNPAGTAINAFGLSWINRRELMLAES
jgi:hypothetical protein